MQNSTRSLSTAQRTLGHVLLFTSMVATNTLLAQTFVNGNFESGSTGWTGCTLETGTAPTYGGTGTSRVAEVDGNFSISSSDDRLLCQSISGFTIGSIYRIDFDATRRGNNTPPDPVTVTMTMDDALNQTITRSGGYAMVHGFYYFTASLTTHAFRVTPNFQGSFGMLFDNISVTLISALPIDLLYFDAEVNSAEVHLHWSTAAEHNNDHFTVQRSIDGVVFEDVIQVEAAGNSQLPLEYTTIDHSPVSGLAYYRLRQTDVDGLEMLFNVVPVRFTELSGHGLQVFPNPSAGGAAWLCTPGLEKAVTASLSIADHQGRSIYRRTITIEPGIPVDLMGLTHLRQGVYVVSVPLDGSTESARLVVL